MADAFHNPGLNVFKKLFNEDIVGDIEYLCEDILSFERSLRYRCYGEIYRIEVL